MEMFNNDFVVAVKKEIQRRLDAGESTSRKAVVQALGITEKGAEAVISALFAVELLPEYKILKKAGIKPKDYVSTAKVAKKAKKVDPTGVAA